MLLYLKALRDADFFRFLPIDLIFTLLSKDIISLRSIFLGTCFGCEYFMAYSRVNQSENAIHWETDVLNFFDFKYKKIGQIFQNAIKDCKQNTCNFEPEKDHRTGTPNKSN